MITTIGQIAVVLAAGEPTTQSTWFWGLTASDVIAIAALIVLAVMCGLAIRESRASRKHRRLNVTPFLHFVTDGDARGPRYTISVVNGGIGPAKVEGFEIVFLGTSFSHGEEPKLWNSLLEELGKELGESISFNGRADLMAVDTSCQVGGIVDVIHLNGAGAEDLSTYEKLRKFLVSGNLKITVKYKSFYGDTYTERYPPKQDAPAQENKE